MAFSARGTQFGGTYISDERYVRWYATYTYQLNGVFSEIFQPLHRCSKAELSEFFSPEDDGTAATVNMMQ